MLEKVQQSFSFSRETRVNRVDRFGPGRYETTCTYWKTVFLLFNLMQIAAFHEIVEKAVSFRTS